MPFVVVTSEHRTPRYYVARSMIGGGFAVIATAKNESGAQQIADALNAAAQVTAQVIPMKKTKKRA